MKTVKFRRPFFNLTTGIFSHFGIWGVGINGITFTSPAYNNSCDNKDDQQFTGLFDKNAVEIFEGDIVKFKRPYRSTQTHTGDNIPNGSYTEPMEPAIEVKTYAVEFKDGIFGTNNDNPIFNESLCPLIWEVDTEYSEDALKDSISYGGKDIFDWHNGEDGDLDYLLIEYKYTDLKELLDDISGIEIIGNIYENPELL